MRTAGLKLAALNLAGLNLAGLGLVALIAGSSAANAQYVPPFKGNDTGGIIAYSLTGQTDIKALADDHCARYGKVVKLTGVQAYYGGYLSFACLWVPPGGLQHPLRVRY